MTNSKAETVGKETDMKERKRKKKFLAVLCSMALVFFMRFGTGAALVYGASGTVYTCTIYPCYAHPVTGEIEDSGGEAGYATGQGMLEGILYGNGIMEVTDSGEYYLTIRLSMMDYTSNHSFWVQNVGDSQWSSISAAITGNGTDTNGSNSDICIQVPSENCVVRGSMYVDPMGREVIYYFYTGDYAEGNSTDMTATIVTEASGTGTESETQTDSQSENSGSSTSSASASSGSTSSGSSVTPSASLKSSSGTSSGTDSAKTDTQQNTQEDTKNTTGNTAQTEPLQSSIQEAASPSSDTEEATLSQAQGLSLSTQGEETETTANSGNNKTVSIITTAVCVTFSGLVLMAAAAGIVYLFRRNWKRWGSGEDDENY